MEVQVQHFSPPNLRAETLKEAHQKCLPVIIVPTGIQVQNLKSFKKFNVQRNLKIYLFILSLLI